MKRFSFVLLFLVMVGAVWSQNRLSIFIGNANLYAEVELSDFRKRLCVEYNVPDRLLDQYYRDCGRNWGNVGIALEIAKTSGRRMRDVCDYYKRYHRQGWDRILVEIGIRPGEVHYAPFYDRIHHHSDCWHNYYDSYCKRHSKHYKKYKKAKYKKHKHYKRHYRDRYDDDDDDDDDD